MALKVMLDECITMQCAHTVSEYLKLCDPPIESHFLVTYLKQQGALDRDWTMLLTPPEDWLVISSDAGRSAPRVHAKGPPLPMIVLERRLKSVFLRGKSLTQNTGAERARILITKMPEILRTVGSSPDCCRYKLSRAGNGFVLSRWQPD